MEYCIKTIDHNDQRYETCGDFWIDDHGIRQIRVSKLNNDDYHFLIMLHEMIEQYISEKDGVTEQQITDFDLYYEKRREMGLVSEGSEPGFDTNAPYRKYHTISTGIELVIAAQLGIDWNEYDRTVNSLSK